MAAVTNTTTGSAGDRIHLESEGLTASVSGTAAASQALGSSGAAAASAAAQSICQVDATPIAATIKAAIASWPAESLEVVTTAGKAGIHLNDAAMKVVAGLNGADEDNGRSIAAAGQSDPTIYTI